MNNTLEHYRAVDTKTIAHNGDYKYLKQTLDDAVADVLSLHKQLEEAKEFIADIAQPKRCHTRWYCIKKAMEVLEQLDR